MKKPEPIVIEREVCGRTLKIETGKIATQANTVIVTYGETVVLCAVTDTPGREGMDFFPMTVDYRERLYAAGKFPGGFIKRETRPSNGETLTSRAIDRPLRPLFPKEYRDEVNINIITMSYDGVNDPQLLAMFAASAALCISPCPFAGPVGVARIGRVDGKLVANPTIEQMEESDMSLNLSAKGGLVVMVEQEGAEISEEQTVEAIEMAIEVSTVLEEMQTELAAKINPVKVVVEPFVLNEEVYNEVKAFAYDKLEEGVQIPDKKTRYAFLDGLKEELTAEFLTDDVEDKATKKAQVFEAVEKIRKGIIRSLVMDDNKRSDGRAFDEVRGMWTEVGMLPRAHGTGVFTRGQTQCMSVVTLGSAQDRQRVDGLGESSQQRFMLHYNFPHFSVGETGFNRGAGRREIGHGELAERSLKYLLPSEEDFPYTIRVVSDIMESAGSTSMAAVCSASLALCDAGVPLKRPVAGISAGLMTRNGDISEYKILCDIYDEEDFSGDMDFKVAGTTEGITGIQCDMKVHGISMQIVKDALESTRKARLDILKAMDLAITKPREELSDFAPQMSTIQINPSKIGAVIGPGGAMIREIEAETGASLNIDDDGTIVISCNDKDGMQLAISKVKGITAEIEDGAVYDGKVTSIKNFGMFVEVLPGQEGLVHISEVAHHRVEDLEKIYKGGDRVLVNCIGIDAQKRARLSAMVILPE
jgi:polyribonucleotide nucleotidyltransferase